MKSYVLNRSMKAHLSKQIRTALLAVGIITFASANAPANCVKVDNFSYSYPAYNANWSQDDCEAYAASGIGHAVAKRYLEAGARVVVAGCCDPCRYVARSTVPRARTSISGKVCVARSLSTATVSASNV